MSWQYRFMLAKGRGNIIIGINAPDILSSMDEMVNFVWSKI